MRRSTRWAAHSTVPTSDSEEVMDFIPRGPFDVMGNARTAEGEKMGEGRAKGFHVSMGVQAMRQAANLPGEIEGEQEGIRMQLGFLWEYAVELVLQGMPIDTALAVAFKRYMAFQVRAHVVKQMKLEYPDTSGPVHGTPDGFDAEEGIIESYKLTWKSKKKAVSKDEFAEHFWPWLVAEKAYCLMLGVDTTRFYIGWVNGDYSFKKGGGPQIDIYDCVYTEDELVENWRSLMAYKTMMGL